MSSFHYTPLLPPPHANPAWYFPPNIINDCNINNHRAWLIFCNCSQNFINFPDRADLPPFLPPSLPAYRAVAASSPLSYSLWRCASWPATPRLAAQHHRRLVACNQLLSPSLTQIASSHWQLLLPSCCQSSSLPFPSPPFSPQASSLLSSGGVASILTAPPA